MTAFLGQPDIYWKPASVSFPVKGCQMPALSPQGCRYAAKLRGQASDKPRGRKPREAQRWVRIGDSLWGFERWLCL